MFSYKVLSFEVKCVEYIRTGTTATFAFWQFLIFCAAIHLSIQQPHTLNEVQYLADRDVDMTWFQKWWLRCLNLNAASASQSKRTCEAVSNTCLYLPHPGLSTSPIFKRCLFKWQFPVISCVIILSWLLRRLSNFPSFEKDLNLPLFVNWLPVRMFLTSPARWNVLVWFMFGGVIVKTN
jgi:hypothetical protein